MSKVTCVVLSALVLGALSSPLARGVADIDVLNSVAAVSPRVAAAFREPAAFVETADGRFLIFDRRAHTVFGIDPDMTAAYPIVEIGAEPGRILDPLVFAAAGNGSFVVADAPRGQGRVQVFSSAGQLLQHFLLPGPAKTRLTVDGFAATGIASMQYTGDALLICQPDWGGLITEYSLVGQPLRTFGQLRATGHEDDRDVHLALNSGIAVAAPDGGFFFVFLAGRPVIRRYRADGTLMFERLVQGQEIDPLVARLPDHWPRGADEQPLIAPTVRAAAVDARGQFWISFSVPFTYVFDAQGDKVRVVQFRAGGVVSPNNLSFDRAGRLLVTPGLAIFDPAAISDQPAEPTVLEPVVLERRPPPPAR